LTSRETLTSRAAFPSCRTYDPLSRMSHLPQGRLLPARVHPHHARSRCTRICGMREPRLRRRHDAALDPSWLADAHLADNREAPPCRSRPAATDAVGGRQIQARSASSRSSEPQGVGAACWAHEPTRGSKQPGCSHEHATPRHRLPFPTRSRKPSQDGSSAARVAGGGGDAR
jgi:hypothetical protein